MFEQFPVRFPQCFERCRRVSVSSRDSIVASKTRLEQLLEVNVLVG
jgi:hypothetical protein